MAKKTLTDGVYFSDEQERNYQQMRRTLLYVVESFTTDVPMQIEGLIAALVSVARATGVSKEKIVRATELVYDNVKNKIDN